MPAILTHHLFGLDVRARLASAIGASTDETDAFQLGNVGPDPLFCLKAIPRRTPYRELGSVMHTRRTAQLMAAVHREFIAHPAEEREALASFALGFLCHYLLDSTVHPLVYAQQYTLCNAGIDGLTQERVGRTLHALIETEFDEYLLTKKLGVTVDAYPPHEQALRCSDETLGAISSTFVPISHDVYGIDITPRTFLGAVHLYRWGQAALDSKRTGARRFIDYARITGKTYARIQAHTHTAQLRQNSDFTNNDHFPWPHPFETGATLSASFDELYERALKRAIELVPQFADPAFPSEDIRGIVDSINFYGAVAS